MRATVPVDEELRDPAVPPFRRPIAPVPRAGPMAKTPRRKMIVAVEEPPLISTSVSDLSARIVVKYGLYHTGNTLREPYPQEYVNISSCVGGSPNEEMIAQLQFLQLAAGTDSQHHDSRGRPDVR